METEYPTLSPNDGEYPAGATPAPKRPPKRRITARTLASTVIRQLDRKSWPLTPEHATTLAKRADITVVLVPCFATEYWLDIYIQSSVNQRVIRISKTIQYRYVATVIIHDLACHLAAHQLDNIEDSHPIFGRAPREDAWLPVARAVEREYLLAGGQQCRKI